MTTPQPPRIAIVGAGILGLAHAVAALDAGYRVCVLEQDPRARLASVQNFGHIGASVHAGDFGELARESLPLWQSLAERAGVSVRRSGTLVVARTAAEDAVLREYVSGDPARVRAVGAELIGGREAATRLGVTGSEPPVSGLLLPRDLTVNPRTAVASIAAWVAAHERGEVRFSETVTRIGERRGGARVVETNRGDAVADHVIVTAGHLVGRLFPGLSAKARVRECALQMMRVRPPHDMGLGPAVLTGTSMLRYSAFAGAAADALRLELSQRRPELLEIGANVMLTQQADGTLIVGDSHDYFDAAPPFMDERWSQLLLGEAAALLGVREPGNLEVLERWQGVYASSERQQLLHASPDDGVSVVTLTTGVGMTIGLALGVRTIAGLGSPKPGAPKTALTNKGAR